MPQDLPQIEIPPVQPAVPITFEQLEAKVMAGEISEHELTPYFDELPEDGSILEPRFQMNGNVLNQPLEESNFESALLMNTANAWASHLRRNDYYRKLKKGGDLIRVVAEGDSWFQYPVKLWDVIDHLAMKPQVAVRCFSAAGDVLSNMVGNPQFLDALRTEKPHVFLISGCGNDLVDGRGLRDLLHTFSAGRKPEDYMNAAYAAYRQRIVRLYGDLFKMVRREDSQIRILCHGYDYAIPNRDRGPWLGKPMEDIGITDRGLQFKIMKLIVNDINESIAKAVENAGPNVKYVDVRGSVPDHGWHNEFHPNSNFFGHVADRIWKAFK